MIWNLEGDDMSAAKRERSWVNVRDLRAVLTDDMEAMKASGQDGKANGLFRARMLLDEVIDGRHNCRVRQEPIS